MALFLFQIIQCYINRVEPDAAAFEFFVGSVLLLVMFDEAAEVGIGEVEGFDEFPDVGGTDLEDLVDESFDWHESVMCPAAGAFFLPAVGRG